MCVALRYASFPNWAPASAGVVASAGGAARSAVKPPQKENLPPHNPDIRKPPRLDRRHRRLI